MVGHQFALLEHVIVPQSRCLRTSDLALNQQHQSCRYSAQLAELDDSSGVGRLRVKSVAASRLVYVDALAATAKGTGW
eukprot:6178938-Pleurochrysis_carterae.AAC.2